MFLKGLLLDGMMNKHGAGTKGYGSGCESGGTEPKWRQSRNLINGNRRLELRLLDLHIRPYMNGLIRI